MPDLSVIIPVKQGDLTIGNCLHAVLSNDGLEIEVIVVLDGWDVVAFKEKFLKINPSVKVYALPKSGPAACRNHGAKLSSAAFLCFLDSDVLVQENTFLFALTKVKASGEAGLIGSYDAYPSSSHVISKFRNLFHHYHHQRNHLKSGVFWGAFGIVRKSAFEEVGGFDQSFSTPSVEDIELGIRLAQKNHVVRIHSDLQVKHLKNWTFFNWMKTDIFLRAKPWTKLMHAHREQADNHLNTSTVEKISALLTTILVVMCFGLFYCSYCMLIIPIIVLLFLLLQKKFYVFAAQNFKVLPLIFLFHQLYFLFALTGFILGRLEISYQTLTKTA
ncbi:glycosyltransferase family 2 protein [Rhodonellum sp.]|uniref:glycosyltransferase n=1 Tax=Rhodonellum sp. TaxID=2231180 RepID=UPI00271F061C|nr:glycosyltransferase [Rhodonellum sp.]MDO9551129.1 glycosyltransferase [Rhodonellum sp.]